MTDPETAAIVSTRAISPAPGSSAASLNPDPLDAPAGTSIAEAQKSAEMAGMMASGAHGMSHGEYVHTDAGRQGTGKPQQMQHPMPGDAISGNDSGASQKPAPGGHSGHQMTPAAPQKTPQPAPRAEPRREKKPPPGSGHESHGTAAPSVSPSSQKAQTLYTCPMHPEVQSATPGKCPKCGMTLVKKEKK